MEKQKKQYIVPEIIEIGTLEKVTKTGGGNLTDVPGGTPANNPPGITGSAYYG